MTDATPLADHELAAYFAFNEVTALLEHGVEQQLREDGGIGNVQFHVLIRLRSAPTGRLRMTDLADGLVYSRSGITYQAGQLEKAGLVTRSRAEDDDRGVVVELTTAGRAVLDRVLPGHIEVVRRLFFDAMTRDDVAALSDIMSRVRDRMRTAPPRSARPRKPGRERSPRSSG